MSERIAVPLPKAYLLLNHGPTVLAWLECRVIPEPHIQKTYDLFLGEVVAAWADPEVFANGRWHFPDAERRSIHYLAGGSFFATGEPFDA